MTISAFHGAFSIIVGLDRGQCSVSPYHGPHLHFRGQIELATMAQLVIVTMNSANLQGDEIFPVIRFSDGKIDSC